MTMMTKLHQVMMMMMTLHQARLGRQDNHATNHVSCARTSRAEQSRMHIEAKHSEIIYLSNASIQSKQDGLTPDRICPCKLNNATMYAPNRFALLWVLLYQEHKMP
jgi:hypothetical protein